MFTFVLFLYKIKNGNIYQYWTLNPAEKNEILKSFVDKILYSKSIKNNSHHKNLDDANVEIFLKI